jgi:hypothetical protein
MKNPFIRRYPNGLWVLPFLVFVLAGLRPVYPRFSVFFDSTMRRGVRRKAVFT